jgi:competence protein ComEC
MEKKKQYSIIGIIIAIILAIGVFLVIPPTDSSPQLLNPLEVIFFDVGQADSILLKVEEYTMLIDAGNIGQDKLMLNYLATYNVTRLDYLVATHPDADHIGSMVSVITTMDSIGTIIMPNAIQKTPTATFTKFNNTIYEMGISFIIPDPGQTFSLGKAEVQVVAPNGANYGDMNDWSIVLRVEYGDTAFLFTGDAHTNKSENEQLASGFPLQADVLKVGHHGSKTSSSQAYLNAVAPTFAVISCGTGNPYGHPHNETINSLNAMGVTIYRTDEQGTIIAVSDGKTIEFKVIPSPEKVYIGNKNTKTLHLDSCGSLPIEANREYFESREDAIAAGYNPCTACKP